MTPYELAGIPCSWNSSGGQVDGWPDPGLVLAPSSIPEATGCSLGTRPALPPGWRVVAFRPGRQSELAIWHYGGNPIRIEVNHCSGGNNIDLSSKAHSQLILAPPDGAMPADFAPGGLLASPGSNPFAEPDPEIAEEEDEPF